MALLFIVREWMDRVVRSAVITFEKNSEVDFDEDLESGLLAICRHHPWIFHTENKDFYCCIMAFSDPMAKFLN